MPLTKSNFFIKVLPDNAFIKFGLSSVKGLLFGIFVANLQDLQKPRLKQHQCHGFRKYTYVRVYADRVTSRNS